MPLSLSLFGPMDMTWAGRSISFATTAARAFLAYLALEANRPHQRELLAALLWPDQPQTAAYTNLRQSLARLRKALPPPDELPLLAISARTIQLQSDAAMIDVVRFEALLAMCCPSPRRCNHLPCLCRTSASGCHALPTAGVFGPEYFRLRRVLAYHLTTSPHRFPVCWTRGRASNADDADGIQKYARDAATDPRGSRWDGQDAVGVGTRPSAASKVCGWRVFGIACTDDDPAGDCLYDCRSARRDRA